MPKGASHRSEADEFVLGVAFNISTGSGREKQKKKKKKKKK
jgi:hypothetical protein